MKWYMVAILGVLIFIGIFYLIIQKQRQAILEREYMTADEMIDWWQPYIEDSSNCKDLQSNRHYTYTFPVCIENVALMTNNPELCERIEITKDDQVSPFIKVYCYYFSALKSDNINLCKKIELIADNNVTKDFTDVCEAVLTDDISKCDELTGIIPDLRKDCYKDIVSYSKNIEICDQTKEIVELNDCYFSIAVNNKDKNICDSITDSEKINYCKTLIESLDDSSRCDSLNENSEFYNPSQCRVKVALINNDVSLCKLVRLEYQAICVVRTLRGKLSFHFL